MSLLCGGGMGKRHARNTVIVLPQDLVKSPAWLSLRGSSTQIYLILRTKMQWVKLNKRVERPTCVNNGSLILTYQEASTKYGIGKDAFTAGIDALIDRGFVDIAGGGGLLKTAS